jgi:SAM-dependent methyltransferase
MKNRGRLLDVGSGLGYFMKSARDDGWEVSGTDTQRSAVEYCKDHLGIEVFLGDIWEFHLVEEPFDVITLWDVWEHVHDPIGFVERCINFLKPGGILAMAIPNASGWPARLFKGSWRYVMFTHLSYFTLPYVEELMISRGLFLEKADHTMKAQSLIQGFGSWLPFNMDTERMIRLGRLKSIEGDRPEKKSSDGRIEKSWINRVILRYIRRLVFKFNMIPMPGQMGDIMDLYFRKRTL